MARHHSTDKPQAPDRATLGKVRRRLRGDKKALFRTPAAPHLRARLGHYFVVDLDGLAIIATHRDPARMLDELLGNTRETRPDFLGPSLPDG